MEVSLKTSTGATVKAQFIAAVDYALPSLQDGWRFNFEKHKRTQGLSIFAVVSENEPYEIEGCIALKDSPHQDLFMAYVEIAPHNQKPKKRYSNVAACLIAFGCRESFKRKGETKGYLAFNAVGADQKSTERLIEHYQANYGAVRVGQTNAMFIAPEQGEHLINQYLKQMP